MKHLILYLTAFSVFTNKTFNTPLNKSFQSLSPHQSVQNISPEAQVEKAIHRLCRELPKQLFLRKDLTKPEDLLNKSLSSAPETPRTNAQNAYSHARR